MRLRFGALSVQAGLIRNPRYSWENTGSRAVCWRGRASGGNGLRAPARVATGRHRVTDSPRPRQQARPESSIRAPLNALTPSIPPPTPVSFCSHIKSHFELPPTIAVNFIDEEEAKSYQVSIAQIVNQARFARQRTNECVVSSTHRVAMEE